VATSTTSSHQRHQGVKNNINLAPAFKVRSNLDVDFAKSLPVFMKNHNMGHNQSKNNQTLPSMEEVVKEVQKTYVAELEKLFKTLDQNLRKKVFIFDMGFRGHYFDIPIGCEDQVIRDVKQYLQSLGFQNFTVEHCPEPGKFGNQDWFRYKIDIFSIVPAYDDNVVVVVFPSTISHRCLLSFVQNVSSVAS
jgi:hypothetical protein